MTTTWELEISTMTEGEWQEHVLRAARDLGWRIYHTTFSIASESGWPDLTLVRERVVFIELKRERNDLTARQRAWADALRAAGAEVYAPCRPSDYDALVAILAGQRPEGKPANPDAPNPRLLRNLEGPS